MLRLIDGRNAILIPKMEEAIKANEKSTMANKTMTAKLDAIPGTPQKAEDIHKPKTVMVPSTSMNGLQLWPPSP